MVLFYVFSSYPEENPGILRAMLAASIVVSVLRLTMVLSFKRHYKGHPDVWQALTHGSIVAAGFLWGAFGAVTIHMNSDPWTVLMITITTTGLGSGAIPALAPSGRVLRVYMQLLVVPSIIVSLARGGGNRFHDCHPLRHLPTVCHRAVRETDRRVPPRVGGQYPPA